MSFVAPLLLLGLLLVPAAVWLYLWHDERSRPTGAAFVSAALLPAAQPAQPGWRRHVGPAFYVVALTLLLIAAARPKAELTYKVKSASVMLVTDRSGSMLADDVGEERIAAARKAAKVFLDVAPDDVRTGLIAFNHQVKLLQSPTLDRAQLRTEIDALTPGGSTAAGDALAEAVRSLRPKDGAKKVPSAIILLSDGESVRGQDPIPVAREAKKQGIPIYTIALGTEGGVLRSTNDDGTPREQRVPPDRQTLRQIAQISGGEAFEAPDAASLTRVYEKLGRQTSERTSVEEITVGFAGGALALLVLGAGASLVLVGRLP